METSPSQNQTVRQTDEEDLLYTEWGRRYNLCFNMPDSCLLRGFFVFSSWVAVYRSLLMQGVSFPGSFPGPKTMKKEKRVTW